MTFSFNEIDLLHGWKKFPSQHTTFFHLTLSSLYTNLRSRQAKTSPLEGRFIPSLLSGLCPIHSLRKGSSRPEEDKINKINITMSSLATNRNWKNPWPVRTGSFVRIIAPMIIIMSGTDDSLT